MLHRTAALTAGCIAASSAPSASYAQTAADLLARHCLVCHDADGPAPLRLDGPDAVQRHRQLMRALIEDRTMPPAPPLPLHGHPCPRPALTEAERSLLLDALASPASAAAAMAGLASIAAGAATDAHAPSSGRIETIGLWTVPASGSMRVRSFSAEVPHDAPRRIRGWRLGRLEDPTRSPLRMLSFAPDPTRASRILDEAGTGAESMGDVGATPSGALGAISRAAPEFLLPAGFAFELPRGDVVVEATLEPVGRAVAFRPAFELIAAGPTDVRTVRAIAARIVPLSIDAGERSTRLARIGIAQPVDVVGFVAKGGVFLRGFAIEMVAPDGCLTRLAEERDFRMNLAVPTVLCAPVACAPGGAIEVLFHFDNTPGNPLQPSKPPHPVLAGLPPDGEDAAVVILVADAVAPAQQGQGTDPAADPKPQE